MNLLPGEQVVVIYFVQDATSSNKDMRKAFLACQEAKLQPKIISLEEIDDVPQAMNVVFVLEEFQGAAFESLTSSDSLSRVVGPRCLHYCVSREIPIPSNESPVFTMAMKGVICAASLLSKPKKEEIAALIGYMAGSYSHQFTGAVTHLISDEGKSPKCKIAIERKIPIMTTEWVRAVWEASKCRDVSAIDPEFSKYKLPPFKGMYISCSNLSQAVKKKIQAAVEANGGVYMAALEQLKTTALIIGEPDGKKFQAAQLWAIPCLTPQWIYDSVEKCTACPTKNYLVNARPKCSTPTNELQVGPNGLPSFMSNDVSIIPFGGDSVNNTVNETNSTMTSTSSFRCQPTNVAKSQPHKPQMHEHKKLIDEINLVDAAAAGSFLDGCKVFLSGFTHQELDKMKKLINRSGATLFPEISDRLSHVIMGEFLVDHVKEIEKLSEKPHVVGVEWILASIRLKTAAPSDPYLCFKPAASKNTPLPPASPLSHKGLSLLKSSANSDSSKSSPNNGFSTSRKLFVKAPVQKWPADSQDDSPGHAGPDVSSHPAGPDAVSRPPNGASEVPTSKRATSQPPTTPAVETRTTQSAASGTTGFSANDADNSYNTSSSVDVSPFFKDLVFLVIGFDDPTTIIESIFAVGGKVESSHFQGVADYAVIPLNGVSTQLTATDVVTPLWVEDCYEQNKVVPVAYFHQPVPLKLDNSPLKGCVVCVSGYLGKERTFIFNLAGALGAKVQDLFSRKDHPEKNILKSTHLVCKTLSGSKYNAAIKWGIPVVNENWLLTCVSTGGLAPIGADQLKDIDNGIVQTPKNPTLQRLKDTVADASSAIVANTPVRNHEGRDVNETTPGPSRDVTKRVESVGLKEPDATASKVPEPSTENQRDIFAHPADAQSRKRPASPPAAVVSVPDDADVTVPPDPSSKDHITPRNSIGNNTSVDFATPANLKRLSSIGSAGKSPFHQDTPTSPYGRVFLERGVEPSPDTRKKWKRFIDHLPDLYEGSPEVQEFRKRRPSTPLAVVLKQCMVKFGGAEIEGIHPETGELLPNGPFAEWAEENLKGNDASQASVDSSKENPDSLSKELSNLKSRLSSVLTPSQQKAAENELEAPNSTNPIAGDETCNTRSVSWITPKGIDKPSAPAEIQWDFGKPTISVRRQPEPVAKKLRMSNEEDEENQINDQVSKLFEKGKSGAPKQDKRIFVLSQMQPAAREKFEGIIRSLGGEVSATTSYDPKSTHLVVERIFRSEKLLCSVASGKWVLHTSYLTQCYQSRMFLPEEDYEWGNELSRTRLPSLEPGTTEWALARAVHKWRVRRTDLGQPDSFRSFKAVVLTSESKMAAYVRLLQAGNATILPIDRISEATHVFWDEDKVVLPVDRSLLKSRKIHLLKPVYLSDYLAKSPPPNPEEYAIR